MNNIIKKVKSFKESVLLTKGVREKSKNGTKDIAIRKMLLGILGDSLWRNILASKGAMRVDEKKFWAGQNLQYRLIF